MIYNQYGIVYDQYKMIYNQYKMIYHQYEIVYNQYEIVLQQFKDYTYSKPSGRVGLPIYSALFLHFIQNIASKTLQNNINWNKNRHFEALLAFARR